MAILSFPRSGGWIKNGPASSRNRTAAGSRCREAKGPGMTAVGRGRGSRGQEKLSHLAASLPRQRWPDLPIVGDYSEFPWLRRSAPPPQARARFAQRQLTPPLMVLPTLPRVPWSRPIFTAIRHFDRRNGDLGLGLSGNLRRGRWISLASRNEPFSGCNLVALRPVLDRYLPSPPLDAIAPRSRYNHVRWPCL